MKNNLKIIWDKLKNDPASAGVLAGGVLLILAIGVFFWVHGVSKHAEKSEHYQLDTAALEEAGENPDDMEQLISDIEVSASAKNRKLPVYCVETDQPNLALTFDAACGDGNLR